VRIVLNNFYDADKETHMKKVGFVGLGTMGRLMARNLAKAGFDMIVYDVNPDAAQELKNGGAQVADSPSAVAKAAEVVMTMVPDSPDVEAVYTGENGLVSGAHENLILIDSSTISPDVTRKVGEKVHAAGAKMLDAPVGGSPVQAAGGNLIMLVGGDPEVIESCKDVLLAVGEKIIHAGPLGSGEALKLSNNLTSALLAGLVTEGITLAKGSGLDPQNLAELLKGNLPKIIPIVIDKVMNKDFALGFKASLMHKDLRLAMQMAQSNNVALPLGALVKEMYQFVLNEGHGDEDLSSLVTI
jgi:2-hydroxy-3-oxopropionate reductase